MSTPSDLVKGVSWFRRSSVCIERDGVEVYIDPWAIHEPSTADYVLLTHPHYDNFSEHDIDRVRGPETVVVAPASMKKQLEDADHFMRPGDMLQLENIDILSVPAYNTDKKFHTPESAWLGYVFTLSGITYYHAGDTDFLDSMHDIRCDVAFLPCEGRYTMGPDDAARAADACGARAVIPIHWGDSPDSAHNAERLAELVGDRIHMLDRLTP